MIRVKDKIVGWWMCLISKFRKLNTRKQLAVFVAILLLPVVPISIFRGELGVYVFIYYAVIYLFFQIGFTMVKK